MAETAAERLERILQLLPIAGRGDGIAYDELADRLGISTARLQRDLAELTDRDFYMDGGEGGDIQIALESDRVRVWTTGHLQRPTRLNVGEAAALDLGLRILAAEREEPELPAVMRDLLEKLAWAVPGDLLDRFAADGDPDAADALRALIVEAARRRLRVEFSYLKPGSDEPEARSVDPYTVAHAEGHWYVVGWCPERDDVRVFRTDRILSADVTAETFDRPGDFDAADFITDGRVYHPGEEIEVVVRYAGPVAPWLLERGEGELQDDGDVIVRHSVSDPDWIVRHVLQYGGDARVLEPEWVGDRVREAAGRLG